MGCLSGRCELKQFIDCFFFVVFCLVLFRTTRIAPALSECRVSGGRYIFPSLYSSIELNHKSNHSFFKRLKGYKPR